MFNYNVIKQLIGIMDSRRKQVRIYNPCIVKIYRGIHVKDNNYKRFQEMDSKDIQKIIEMQHKRAGK